MATWVRLGDADVVPPGKGWPFETEVGEIAVFNVDGELYAIDNQCPHQASPLGMGRLSGKVVTCRGHGLRFDVTTGLTPGTEDSGVRTYPLDVREDGLYVDIAAPVDAPEPSTSAQGVVGDP